ncbi:hypothetical protein ACOMHN_025360 [Nucella lapillus]
MVEKDREDYIEAMENRNTTKMLDELLKQKQKVKDMGMTIDKNNELLRLIMQKMEIHTEDEAWDEGQKMDRANPVLPLPIMSNTPPVARNSVTSSLSRHILTKTAIVSYLKKKEGK